VPQVSVVMSVHRRVEPRFLEKAVTSIQVQTLKDYEFIIVLDGELTSGQIDILERAKKIDSRVTLLHSERRMGVAYSLNQAIVSSKSEYIARMDADDVSLPTRLERQVAFLEGHGSIDLVGTFAYEVDEEEKILFSKHLPVNSKELSMLLAKRDPFVHPTVIFRATFFERVGLYSSDFLGLEDTELWSRAFTAGILGANIGEFLYMFRVDRDFLKRRRGKVYAREEARLRWNYIRDSRLPLYNCIYPLLTFSMRISPEWVLRRLYKFAR